MTSLQQTSRCRIIPIRSARPKPPSRALLVLIFGQRVIDLAGVVRFIGAGGDLCHRITEAACQEFGWPWLSLEEAVVLLGREGLYRILCEPRHPGRSAGQLRRVLNTNHTAPTAALRTPEIFQGETK